MSLSRRLWSRVPWIAHRLSRPARADGFEVTRHLVTSVHLDAPITLVVASDLHSEPYADRGELLLRSIRAAGPSAILLPGDTIDDRLPEAPGLDLLRELSDIAPTFLVSGNHECRTGALDRVLDAVRSRGVRVLDGDCAVVETVGGPLTLLGLGDPDIGAEAYSAQLDQLQVLDPEGFAVLLAHRPERTADYREVPADLVVSGHAHGGQWRIPMLCRQGLYAPNQGMLPRRTCGTFRLLTARGRSTHLVSRGLSSRSVPLPRLFNRPELLVIEVIPRRRRSAAR